jgi:peptide/nickel transport system ATP-binding protein
MSEPLLSLRGLQVRFDGAPQPTLGPLDFDIAAGECLALVGPSGSGKSLTAASLLGLLPARARVGGELHFDGDRFELALRSPAPLRGHGLVWMPQDALAALHPLRGVGDQLDEMLRRHQPGPRAQRERDAQRCLRRAGLEADARLLRSPPHRLSGGQRQRMLLALCLACRPRLLIADEPTSALDALRAAEVMATFDRLRADGLALLLISHDLGAVARHAERVLVLEAGHAVECAPTLQLFAAPQSATAQRLLAAQRLPAPPPAQAQAPAGAPLLQVASLRLRYPRAARDAVDVPALAIHRGEALALVGESGSGKSSLGRCVLRLLDPAPGARIAFAGHEIGNASQGALRSLRPRLQAVFQDPFASLDPRQRVADIVTETLRVQGIPRAQREARAGELLGEVGLPPEAGARYPHQFSGGQRQRIAIARALASAPDLVVCDEAVSALDAEIQAQILALLARLSAQRGLSLLFITHDLRAAAALCERTAVMQEGRIVECAPTAQLLATPEHAYTQALLGAAQLVAADRG